MEISPTTTSLSPSAARSNAAPPSAISSDFDTFLRMLTVQITNQDPLNPINSEEFAVQLATFSGVEQQVRTNQLLESVISGLGQGDIGQLAGWIGMEARAPMPIMFEGEPVSVVPPEPTVGNRHDLVALNESGTEVWRVGFAPGAGPVTWNGMDTGGTLLPIGTYAFHLESFDDDQMVAKALAQTYGEVQEVRMDRGGTVIVFAGGVERYADEISAVRRGSGDA